MEAPGLGGTRGEGHHCPHCPLRVTLGGVRDVCPQPACCAFPSLGPADALSACTVQSALLSLHLLFFISRHLPSTFSLCFSLIRQSLSASLGRGRSEFAEIVGATCNNPPSSILLPPVHTRAGTPPAPPWPRTVLGTGHPQPALLQAIPLRAALTMRVTSRAWSWEPSPWSYVCLLEPENKPLSPPRLQIVQDSCPDFSSPARCPELHLTTPGSSQVCPTRAPSLGLPW